MLRRRLFCVGALVAAMMISGSTYAARKTVPILYPWAISPEKPGPLKFGMTLPEVYKALNEPAPAPDLITGPCAELPVPGQIDTIMMFENARLSRLSFYGDSQLKTTLGIGIGASESEVMGKYPLATATERGEVARNLTVWAQLNVNGIRFQTNSTRMVEAIHVGGQSITYAGGCT